MNLLHKVCRNIMLLLVGGAIFASCLGNDTLEAYDDYNDLVLTNIAFGTLPRVMHTTTKDGRDSTFTSTVTAKTAYPFTIDHLNNLVYNVDSLPVGVKANKIIFSNFTVKDGTFAVRMLNSEKDTIYAVADTLDFSQGYRDFNLYGADGTSKRTYRVEVRIHQQKPDSVTWDVHTRAEFDERTTALGLPATDYSAAGRLFRLVPGETILVGTEDSEPSTEDAIDAADKEHLPTDNVCWATTTSRVDRDIREVYLYGTRGEDKACQGKFWRRNISLNDALTFGWEYFPTTADNLNPVPALHCAALYPYDKGLLLVGLDANSKIVLKFSSDRGRTWCAHSSLVLPAELKALTVGTLSSALDADCNLWLLIDDDVVWRGRAHRVGWKEEQTIFDN